MLDFAVIPRVIAERSRGEERLVKTRVTLGFGKESRVDGVPITNFAAAAHAESSGAERNYQRHFQGPAQTSSAKYANVRKRPLYDLFTPFQGEANLNTL
jgi:hypothetical protein